MSGVGLVFSILLAAVLILSLRSAHQRKRRMDPESALEDLDLREREAIVRELKAGRPLNAIARLRRAAPSLGPDEAKALIGLLERQSG